MSLMLMSVLGMSAQKSWNFSDAQWYSGVDENDKVIATDYTELTTIDGLTLAATADKKITVDSHKKKVNGVQYIARLKMGGAGNVTADGTMERVLSFDVDGPTEITAVVAHSSSSGDPRQLNFCAGTYDKNNPFATAEVAVGDPIETTVQYVGPAKTIYMASASSGLNFYAIKTAPLEGTFYGIVGELTGGWENDLVMTQSTEDPNVYTATVEGFKTGARTYQYKLRSNFTWTDSYQIPATGNQEYSFDSPGIYTLTFTANISTNELTLEAVKTEDIEITSYSIVGELTGGWDNDVDMVKSEENPDVYTLSVDNFYSESNKTYEYKLRANHEWGIYELPMSGNNTKELEAGYYNLTFTANIAENTLDCEAVKLVILDNIAAMKAYDGEGVVQVKLTDAKVTYTDKTTQTGYFGDVTETEHIVIEDATGGYNFQNVGALDFISQGMTLNGTIEIEISDFYGIKEYAPTENTLATFQALEKEEGTVEPLLVTDDNWDEYAENYDWRYMKMTKVPLKVTVDNSYGLEQTTYTLAIEQMGEEGLQIEDMFSKVGEDLTDGMVVDIEGYIMSYYGYLTAFVPTSITEHIDYYTIVGELTGGWPTDEAQTDMLMTRSEEDKNVYTLVVEGFEAFPKAYEYKLRTNYNWDEYQLPAEGNNTYTFPELGVYTLTFTANLSTNELTVEAEKTGDYDVTFSVIGDLTGGWEADVDMVKSEENANVYTAEVKTFYNEGDKTYEYKLRANHQWGVFEIPADGSNQTFYLGDPGLYDLTFTANIADGSLICEAVKSVIPETVDIVVTNDVNDGTLNYITFSSPYPLDLTGIEGLTAYTGKKHIEYDTNTYTDYAELIMTPIEQVPSYTGIVIKATEAKTYTVPTLQESLPAVADNDLLVAPAKTDLFPLINGYSKGIGKLKFEVLQIENWYTQTVSEVEALGFFPLPVPAEQNVDFLEKGDVYLSFNYDELFEMGYANDYVQLIFTDLDLPVVEDIASLLALKDGTQATLKFAENTVVTFANENIVAIQDNTAGMFLNAIPLDVKAGDVLTGEISGSLNIAMLYPCMEATAMTDASTVVVSGTAELNPSEVNFEQAFEPENYMRLVKLTNITASVEKGEYYNIVKFADSEGTELEINDLAQACVLDLPDLQDGDVLAEVQGYAYIIPEGSYYVNWYGSYQFQPISIEKKHTYAIVGDFFATEESDGWENDQPMTQSEEDPNVYTLVVEDFVAEAKQYDYKLRADGQWGIYDLPMDGNQNFIFGTEGYPAGKYNLTFTANVAEHTLTLDVKSAIVTGINGVNVDWNDGNTYNLNGQRLTKPVKGIVIRTGRKVVVK